MKENIIKFPKEQLNREERLSDKYSHPAFNRKLPRDIKCVCDFSKYENKIEVEMLSGNKYWFELSIFFGPFIFNVDAIYIENKSGPFPLMKMNIVGVEVSKVKRTNYIRLIFEVELPF